ncbi:MAG TPA: hypothetical protein VF815_45490 [Myxococcaceae bacterium]
MWPLPEGWRIYPPLHFPMTGPDPRPAPGDAKLFKDISSREQLSMSWWFYWVMQEVACGRESITPCDYEAAMSLLEDAGLYYESAYFDSLEIGAAPSASEQQKGNLTVPAPGSSAEAMNEPPRPRGNLLAACAGLTLAACSAVQVRQVDTEWLEDCPAEAHAAVGELGLRPGAPYLVELLNETGRRNYTPFFLQPGPVEAMWHGRWPGTEPPPAMQNQLKGAKLFGKATVLGNRMSVHLDRLKTADGREFPICAVGYDREGTEPGVERWGPGSHEGVDVGNDDPRLLAALADLRPGEFPVPTPDIWISFSTSFRPELFPQNAVRRKR